MSSGNITYVVDKLEKKQVVRRRASTEDRRLIYAELTEQGKQFVEDVFPAHQDTIEQAVNGLSTEEKHLASKLLKKLGKFAQDHYK